MAGLTDDAQWIILLAFVISVSIFFLALIVNESVLVGQTTAESVLDLPKSDIQDMRDEVFRSLEINGAPVNTSDPTVNWANDMANLSINRKNAIVKIIDPTNNNNNLSDRWRPVSGEQVLLSYNNGVVNYSETFLYL